VYIVEAILAFIANEKILSERDRVFYLTIDRQYVLVFYLCQSLIWGKSLRHNNGSLAELLNLTAIQLVKTHMIEANLMGSH